MILEAFDPGAMHYGWSWFQGQSFKACGLVRLVPGETLSWEQRVAQTCRVSSAHDRAIVVERMATYRGRAAKGDSNDLLRVEYTAGLIVGASRCSSVRRPTAAEWKGQTPKKIHHQRIQATLDLDEWARLRNCLHALKTADQSHVLDAVGLGLWALGRKLKGGR